MGWESPVSMTWCAIVVCPRKCLKTVECSCSTWKNSRMIIYEHVQKLVCFTRGRCSLWCSLSRTIIHEYGHWSSRLQSEMWAWSGSLPVQSFHATAQYRWDWQLLYHNEVVGSLKYSQVYTVVVSVPSGVICLPSAFRSVVCVKCQSYVGVWEA